MRWLTREHPDLDEAREAALGAVRNAKRAADIINRIRSMSRKGDSKRQLMDINEVIREIIAMLHNEAQRHSVTIRADLDGSLSKVMADSVQVQQVMMNLIMNGIDAMREVTDRPRELFIKSAKHPAGVLVQVQDSGVGFDSDQADRIFEPFFTTKPKGIGMGLSISRSIIEAHGGRLWAAPGPVQGAVFQFNLPKADTPDERAA